MKQRPPIPRDVAVRDELLCLSTGKIGDAAGGRRRRGRVTGDVRCGRPFEIWPDGAARKEQRGREQHRVPDAQFANESHGQFLGPLSFVGVPSITAALRLLELAAPPITGGLGSRWRTLPAEGGTGRVGAPGRAGGGG